MPLEIKHNSVVHILNQFSQPRVWQLQITQQEGSRYNQSNGNYYYYTNITMNITTWSNIRSSQQIKSKGVKSNFCSKFALTRQQLLYMVELFCFNPQTHPPPPKKKK